MCIRPYKGVALNIPRTLYLLVVTGLLSLTPSLQASDQIAAVSLALINNTELRKSQKNELEKTLANVKKQAEEACKKINGNLASISAELQEAHQQLEGVTDLNAE